MEVLPAPLTPPRWRNGVTARAAAVGVVAAIHVVPTGSVDHGPVLCPFRRFTGLPCPGCGMTRAVSLSAHWRFADAVRMHPLGPVVYVGLLALAALVVIRPAVDVRRLWHRAVASSTVRRAAMVAASTWIAWAAVRAVRVAIHRDPTW